MYGWFSAPSKDNKIERSYLMGNTCISEYVVSVITEGY